MDIFLYLMIFIMGTFFGSFFTLAVYRIPLKKDITHEHSFCPNCNHKLGVLDLIPVWSYIFLKGKCRYCGEKVRIRYLLLEVLSGIVFVLAFLSLNIENIIFDTEKLIYFVAFVFQYVTLVLVAGIDKEYKKINKSILLFGTICQTIYMVYLCVVMGGSSIYRYSIYLAIFAVLFLVLTFWKSKQESYILQILLLVNYILYIAGFKAILFVLILGLLCSIFYKKKSIQMPVGFIIGFSTVVYIIVENFLKFYNI